MFEKFISSCVSILPKKLQDLYYKYEDIMLYIFFGVLTTLVYLASKFTLAAIMGKGVVVVTIYTIIANLCAITFAFFTNKKYVFKSETHTKKDFWKEFVAFYAARGITLLIDTGISALFIGRLEWNVVGVTLVSQVLILTANYVFSKLIVFKKKA